jgi:regulator of protease activity HflC (stomatin/prohibitin superfamily)
LLRKENAMRASTGIQFAVWLITMLLGGLISFGVGVVSHPAGSVVFIVTVIAAFLAASAVRLAAEWERAIVLRLGKFHGERGPGLFFIVPVIDTVPYVIDLRTITTIFKAEQTMTRDTVPVDVDAVLFWRVVSPEKAALEVASYQQAVTWAAQTALRDIIGRSSLAELLSNREQIDINLRSVIDQRTEPWGTRVDSVEIRDVVIPVELQNAMSRQAQAERERQARLILGDSEMQIAQKFADAAQFYADNPTALHLRAMNMLYEGLKDKGALIIVPSSAVDTMNLGSIAGYAALGAKVTANGVALSATPAEEPIADGAGRA